MRMPNERSWRCFICAFVLACGLAAAGCAPQPVQTRDTPSGDPDTPAVLVRIQPEYPDAARSQGVEGYATVSFRLNAHGNPIDIRVVDADPEGIFDKAAIQAIRYWMFRSSEELARSGRRFRQTFEFRL